MAAKRKQIAPVEEWPKKAPPTERQLEASKAARERARARPPELPMEARKDERGSVQVGATIDDERVYFARLTDVVGSNSGAWLDGVIKGLVNARGGAKDDNSPHTLQEGLAFLAGVAPRDEVEAALGAQMFAVHCATMQLAQRMAASELRDQYRDYGNLLVKTSRTFAAQVEALARLRSGGKQQVEVRYVYVDARGGQNIIASQLGGGRDQGNQQQPCVPGLPFAPGAQMWSADAAGLALPATGDAGQEPVPATWREEPGSAGGSSKRELQERSPHEGSKGRAAGAQSPHTGSTNGAG